MQISLFGSDKSLNLNFFIYFKKKFKFKLLICKKSLNLNFLCAEFQALKRDEAVSRPQILQKKSWNLNFFHVFPKGGQQEWPWNVAFFCQAGVPRLPKKKKLQKNHKYNALHAHDKTQNYTQNCLYQYTHTGKCHFSNDFQYNIQYARRGFISQWGILVLEYARVTLLSIFNNGIIFRIYFKQFLNIF